MEICLVVLHTLLFVALDGVAASRVGIVGGREARAHSRPYMASLQTRFGHVCGGVLIREDFVLTAAHCSRRLQVVLGAHSLSGREPSKQTFAVQRSIPHPKYDGEDNDIMLLKLAGRARLTKEVQLIPLMQKTVGPRSVCTTAGWGDVGDNDTLADRLQEVSANILSTRTCKSRWSPVSITRNMVCATGPQAFQGFCSGDSGGPLVCNGMSAGVVSFSGRKCANPKYPDVYTRVSTYLRWIQQVVDPAH